MLRFKNKRRHSASLCLQIMPYINKYLAKWLKNAHLLLLRSTISFIRYSFPGTFKRRLRVLRKCFQIRSSTGDLHPHRFISLGIRSPSAGGNCLNDPEIWSCRIWWHRHRGKPVHVRMCWVRLLSIHGPARWCITHIASVCIIARRGHCGRGIVLW